VTETFITYVKENCMCCVTNIINWMFWTHDCFHRFDVFAFYKTALVNAFFFQYSTIRLCWHQASFVSN